MSTSSSSIPPPGNVGGIETGPLGGLALADDGSLLALEKADRPLRIDPATGKVVARVPVEIDDEHMEVVAALGAAFVSSDHTPLRRVAVPAMTIEETLDVGGGVPFLLRDGLVWGARPETLWAIDPESIKVERTVPLVDVIEVLALDIDGDDAWIAARRPGYIGTVLHLDLASGELVAEYPVTLPAAIRIAGDRVWVASYLTNEVLAFAR